MRWIGILAAAFALGMAAATAQPNSLERLPSDDPAIEAKVQSVAEALRCVVCKNQSIADSEAGLAKDMVALVREQIEAGATEAEAKAFMVDRYGEFVLLKPKFSPENLGLWFSPLLVFAAAAAGAVWFIRSRKSAEDEDQATGLTGAERAELAKRLNERD